MSCGCDGCWTLGEVNVGWYPMRTKRDTYLYTGPSERSSVKVNKGRTVVLVAGDWVGLQSTRNPHGYNLPAPRGDVDRWSFVYSARVHHGGWVRLDNLEECPNKGWARGPAGEDFEVGAQPCNPGAQGGCNGRKARLRRKHTVRAAEVYLRYAPRSTAFWYVVRGDVVKDRWITRSGGFRCVEVVTSKTAPPGTIGWIHESAYIA